MKIKNVMDFVALKETNIIHILGSSESVNDLTPEQWKEIGAVDNFAINNFIYHPFFIPKFYTLELKSYDHPIMKRRFDEKWEMGYKNVNYLLSDVRARYLAEAIGHKDEAKIYVFPSIKRGDHPKTNPSIKVSAKYDPGQWPIVKSYDASATAVIDLIYKMGYETVVFHGHDYSHSRYFWFDGDPKYGEVHHRYNKAHEHNNPGRPHNTFHIMEFIKDFNRRHCLPNGREMFIASKKSLLYPDLRCFYDVEIK